MKLILQNPYPYPYPSKAFDAEKDRIAEEAGQRQLVLEGVVNFQWLHAVTVEFESYEATIQTRSLGWAPWGTDRFVYEAPTSAEDGYGHPAIIANGFAWCGFILVPSED